MEQLILYENKKKITAKSNHKIIAAGLISLSLTLVNLTELLAAGLSNQYTAFSAGYFHNLRINNKLYSWGDNQFGQLGVGTNGPGTNRNAPITISLASGVTPLSVAAGDNHSLAIGSDGKLYTWGANADGELGNGNNTDGNLPVLVNLPTGVSAVSIAAGSAHSLAIGSNGKLYAWGSNAYGQLGDGTIISRNVPVVVNLPTGVTPVVVAAGYAHSLAIGNNGKLYAWGGNAEGELGDGTFVDRNTPVIVSLPSGVSPLSLVVGYFHTIIIASDGKLYSWGDNTSGQLGDGTSTGKATPVAISLSSGVTPASVAAGESHSLAVGNDGKLYAWGNNQRGQLGIGTLTYSESSPVIVSLPAGIVPSLPVAGGAHSFVVSTSGKLYAWGSNYSGELGIGKLTYSESSPVIVTSKARNDFNGDGISDLVWRQASTGTIGILFMSNTGMAASWQGIATDTGWNVVGTGDFNGDGIPDLLWRQTSTGLLGELFMNSNGTIKSWNGLSTGTDWNVVDTADFNGDGISDLVWRQASTGTIGILFMSNTGAAASWQGIATDTGWNVVGTGDFNGDGIPDLLWRQTSTGLLGELFMNSNGTIKSWNGLSTGTDWNVVDTADFNGDGISDLVWRQASTGTIGILFMSNTGAAASWQGIATDTGWNVVGTGDFNGDGIPDLLWRQTSTGLLGELFMNSNGTIKSWNGLSTGTDWNVVAAK